MTAGAGYRKELSRKLGSGKPGLTEIYNAVIYNAVSMFWGSNSNAWMGFLAATLQRAEVPIFCV
jgi:hypothetical protein